MISWKHSFKRLNEEYEIAKKKKQALDNLFENGRISQATRDSFDTDINAVIMEIEKQQKDLLAKMQGKAQELESQIKTLETLLANYEIQHVVGEIDEEIYQREINLLSTGLESAKHELDIIKEATNQISPPVEATTTEPSLPAEENEEVVQNEGVENVSDAAEEVEVATEPAPQEPFITMEETVPEEPAIESSDTMPEETPQAVEETPEAIEDQSEVTEDIPPEIEDQPQVTEEPLQSMDETPETTEDTPEVTEELSQNVQEIEDQPEITEEMPQPMEETPQVIENEPQIVEENPQTGEETPEEAHPSEAPEETPQEISGEVIAEEEQSDEEESATAETDEDTEYQEL